MAEEEETKKQRQYAKATLTRFINKTDKFIVENDTPGLQSHMEKMKDAFQKFESAHERYHALLEDDTKVEESDKYFFDEQKIYIESMKKGNEYLQEKKPATITKVKNEMGSQDVLQLMNFPRVELEIFNGDPLMYHSFRAMIRETIDPLVCNDKIKLTRLLQYSNEDVKRQIRHCMTLKESDAYEEAKKILERKYGDQYLVMDRIVKSLRSGKVAKSPIEVQVLSDEIVSAHTTLKEMGKIVEVDSQTLIVEVIQRLPFFIQRKWKTRALDHKRSSGSYPGFGELADFVNRESEEMNDPVYGRLKPKYEGGSRNTSKSSASFATNVSESSYSSSSQRHRPPCMLCSSDHRLMYCMSFKKMNPRDRLRYVREKKLCENCLLANHSTNNCRKLTVCDVAECGKRHTRLIHVSYDNANGVDSNQSVKIAHASETGVSVHMPVTAVRVNDKYVTTALLDTASSSTFCSEKLVESLGLHGHKTTLMLNTLNASERHESKLVNFDVSSMSGDECLRLTNVYVVKKIPVNAAVADTESLEHLEGLKFTGNGTEVHLLIGQDNAEALVPLETRRGLKGEPFAVRTLLGWTLNGPGHSSSKVKRSVISHFVNASESLESKIESLWSVENEGIISEDLAWSQNDAKVIALWDEHCKLVDNHYEIPIPWRPGAAVPNNFRMAVSRLNSTKKSILKRGLWSKYEDEMEKLFQSGYAEEVPTSEIGATVDKVWYLPHQPVLNDKKPDKLRIVFDCAAKWQGESLNDKCYSGPDLNNKLLYVLLRFRQHAYAILSDVEAMYYQVLIPPDDRNVLRFLWFDSEGHVVQYRMTRHVFGGVWCSASSTYALRRVLSESGDVHDLVADTVLRSFYVDDCLRSVATFEEAAIVIHGTKEVLQKGGFRLTKFVVNEKKLLQLIPEEDRAKEVKDIGYDNKSKALGVRWHVDDDVFFFDIDVNCESRLTRRNILSIVASVFDPLGLVSPVVIVGKIILQEVTRLKIPWDELVPEVIRKKWYSWLESLTRLGCVTIPRCIKTPAFCDSVIQLHHFSDASERAYGCCSYIRCINKCGQIHTALVLSKAKVAPLKQLTIPRLELQAAVLSAKIDAMLRKELDLEITTSFFWVDSELVLKYIRNETRRFVTFVSNRVSTIRSVSVPCQWNFIPGADNPADLLTRGQDPEGIDCEKWRLGPEYLQNYMSEWKIPTCGELSNDDPDVKQCDVSANVSCVAAVIDHPIDKLVHKYSSWHMLKRAIAWILRLKARLLSTRREGGHLTVEEIQQAELVILKHVQQRHYGEEIMSLLKGGHVGRNSALRSLDPILDEEGLMHVGGRLAFATIDEASRRPFIIPHNSPIARLIAREKHEISHSGVEWVVSLIRRRFWITKVRVMVKSIMAACFTCKKMFSAPLQQKMADLPIERIDAFKPPFNSTGVDCFGPFLIKQGRSELKRYGCVFTCLSTRAVHIEKLNGLDTDTFLNAFRRFLARRGPVENVLSDQGTNFTGASAELAKALRQMDCDQISRYSVKNGVVWKFNPPGASHMGGAWERLIRSIRKVMVGLGGGQSRLNDESLETLFCEIEMILNGRPLTKISDDVQDANPLTPNHLLLLREHPSMPPGKFDQADVYRRRWRCVQHLANEFWNRWLREYLPELQRRRKWLHSTRNVRVGDLVLITQESTPRGLWPIGLVVNVHESQDGLVRSVEVQTKSAKLVRPIAKIVLLEGVE